MDSVFARLKIDATQLRALQDQISTRLDRDGKLRDIITTTRPLTTPAGRLLLGLLGAVQQADQLERLLNDHEEHLRVTALSLLLFPPRGWALSGLAPMPAHKAAITLLESNGSVDDAEQELVRGWSTNSMLDSLPHRISASLVPAQDDMWAVCSARGDLVGKAWQHHQAGAYEASIPIALAQAEGLVQDALGKSLFTKKSDDTDIVDDQTLAGLNESLAAARRWFSADVRPSQVTGRCSRHGIMHGRELGYATETNSTKSFVLLAAVYEFAQPRLRDQAKHRRQANEQHWAGSDAIDEHGRRMDRRGFGDARLTLRDVYYAQLAHQRRHGVFTAQPELIRLRSSPHPSGTRWRSIPTGATGGRGAAQHPDGSSPSPARAPASGSTTAPPRPTTAPGTRPDGPKTPNPPGRTGIPNAGSGRNALSETASLPQATDPPC